MSCKLVALAPNLVLWPPTSSDDLQPCCLDGLQTWAMASNFLAMASNLPLPFYSGHFLTYCRLACGNRNHLRTHFYKCVCGCVGVRVSVCVCVCGWVGGWVGGCACDVLLLKAFFFTLEILFAEPSSLVQDFKFHSTSSRGGGTFGLA